MKNRSKAYYRHQRKRTIKRKLGILKIKWSRDSFDFLLKQERLVGKLGKGKVHCSCSCCSMKTKTWGYKKNELSKLKQMENEIKEELN